jgi:dienelactone hydrolase
VLDLPLIRPPGSEHSYSSGDSMLLSGVIEAATGLSAGEYARRHLFGPLAMPRAQWWTDAVGHTLTYCCLDAPSRDFARIGLLYARNGRWDGRQILPERWVHDSAASIGSAYQWYNSGSHLYAYGFDDQWIHLFPGARPRRRAQRPLRRGPGPAREPGLRTDARPDSRFDRWALSVLRAIEQQRGCRTPSSTLVRTRATPTLVAANLVLLLVSVSLIPPAALADPRPIGSGPFSVAGMEIDDGCDFDLDGRSLVWSDPVLGRSQVTIDFTDLGYAEESCRGDDRGLVEMKVRVHYPGDRRRVAQGGPFPLVMVLHGRQPNGVVGYTGYDDLGRLLASHGYVVASIAGTWMANVRTPSRAEHVREHLRRFVARAQAGSGSIFAGMLDLSRVSLVGHSRGGEAMALAWEWQRVAPDPGYSIGAVVGIAPTQHHDHLVAQSLRDVGIQVILGASDCELDGLDGIRLYDRAGDPRAAGSTLKSLVYIERANHRFFNSVWERDLGSDCGSETQVLSGTKARMVANAYTLAFLDTAVRGGTRWRPYLTGQRRNLVAGTRALVDFQAPGSDVVVEDFEGEPHDELAWRINSLGGATTTSSSLEARDWRIHDTHSGALTWRADARDAVWETEIPSSVLAQLEGLDHLSLRVGQAELPFATQPRLDLLVEVVDEEGRTSNPVKARTYGTLVRPAAGPTGIVNLVMTGVRIPLRAFRGVDAQRPRAIRLRPRVLSPGRQPIGQDAEHVIVLVDDIRFAR